MTHALAKGVRQGHLPPRYLATATKASQGIVQRFIETGAHGQVNLTGTVAVAGLGSQPYRDGSYDYYTHEPIKTNDIRGMGAFILAGNELERVTQTTKRPRTLPKIGARKRPTPSNMKGK